MGNNAGLLKIHNGGNYARAQDSNAYDFCWSSNSTKLTLLSRIKAPALISEYLKIWAFIFLKTCPPA